MRTYDILPDHKIRFSLHGSFCGGHGNPSCLKTHRITAKPFKFVEPK